MGADSVNAVARINLLDVISEYVSKDESGEWRTSEETYATALELIKEIDSEVGDWDFTKEIKKWAKSELKKEVIW